jgi:hypothetical protein
MSGYIWVSSLWEVFEKCSITTSVHTTKRCALYTKEEKPHDKTTSHKLGEVDLHSYSNIQFSPWLLYTHTHYTSYFIYLYLLYLYYLCYFIMEFQFYTIFYILIFYNNHVNDISYFLTHCQLYIKIFMGHSLNMALRKKLKHAAVIIFNYLLIVFTYWIICVQDRGKWKEVVEKAKTFCD